MSRLAAEPAMNHPAATTPKNNSAVTAVQPTPVAAAPSNAIARAAESEICVRFTTTPQVGDQSLARVRSLAPSSNDLLRRRLCPTGTARRADPVNRLGEALAILGRVEAGAGLLDGTPALGAAGKLGSAAEEAHGPHLPHPPSIITARHVHDGAESQADPALVALADTRAARRVSAAH